MNILELIIVLVGSYLIGSITTGDIVAHFKKVDLRGQGSGNVGATNVFRTMGSVFGAIVLIGDAAKGVLAVLLGAILNQRYGFDWSILTGTLAIIGHNWPIYTGFKGGKGIATSLGVLIGLTPLSLLVAIPVWLVTFVIFGFVSLASLFAAIFYPVSVFWLYPGEVYKLAFAILIAVLAVYRHKTNIKRLLNGEEHRILYKKRGAKK